MAYKKHRGKQKPIPTNDLDNIVNNYEITSKSIYTEFFPWKWPQYETVGAGLAPEQSGNIRSILHKHAGVSGEYGVIMYMANGKMLSLEALVMESDQRDWCNTHGVHILFYEPLCFYSVKHELPYLYNFGFYSEFDERDTDPAQYRCGELDSVKIFVENNDLTNVTVHTGDYNIETWGIHYADTMTLTCNDVFLGDLQYYHTHEFELKREFTHKFISTSWRYTSARHITMAWLESEQDHYKSWYFDNSLGFDWTGRYGRPNSMINSVHLSKYVDRFENLDAASPYVLDLPCAQATQLRECAGHLYPQHIQDSLYDHGHNPVHENLIHYRLRNYYADVFCDLVTESRFAQPTGNISEKVFQSILYATPFLLIAPHHSLQYMKDLGFQTFSDWWPEDYDNIRQNDVRLAEILRVAQTIRKRSIEDLRIMYLEMTDVFKHNWHNLITNVCISGRVATRQNFATETVSKSFAPDHADAGHFTPKTVSKTGIRT